MYLHIFFVGSIHGIALKSPTSVLNKDVCEKPDSQLSEKIKEDEVSSSEEAFKMDNVGENITKEGKMLGPDET